MRRVALESLLREERPFGEILEKSLQTISQEQVGWEHYRILIWCRGNVGAGKKARRTKYNTNDAPTVMEP